jgi:regulator of protease activity HflC (stomatin/prohibitin superfamily)
MHSLYLGIWFLFFGMAFFFLVVKGYQVVPQQEAWIVQRLGKYHRQLSPGLNWLAPFLDVVAYVHSFKEEAMEIREQMAITQDNVTVTMDGVLYIKVVDPVAASYGVKDPKFAISQLVQTSMRSEIGKLPLDRTFQEREMLNTHIVETINEAASAWGIRALRYEIKDINMPDEIRKAMELQMTAERQKRARILESEGIRQAQINESEGKRQAEINIAEGMKQKTLLSSEASIVVKVNAAKAEAESILALAKATGEEVQILSEVLQTSISEKAISLKLAQEYLETFKELAQKSTTLMLPSDIANPASMVTQSLSLFDAIRSKQAQNKHPSEHLFLKKNEKNLDHATPS